MPPNLGAKVAGKEESKNIIGQSVGFMRESWVELKKVQKPTRQEATQATVSVLFLVVVFAVFLGFIDFLLGKLMQVLLT